MQEFKVLVADSDKDFLEAIVKRLQDHELDASGVDHGEAAVQLLHSQDFDVVILDEGLPGLDGLIVCQSDLDTLKQPLTEVIMVTGDASVVSGIQVMQLGAFDYVMKPVPPDELVDKTRQAYKHKLIRERKL